MLLFLLVALMLPANEYHQASFIELNHYTVASKREGKVELVKGHQYIAWVWDAASCRHQIAMWELAERVHVRSFRGVHTLEYRRRQGIKVKATRFIETWTDYDPELRERDILAPELRLGHWWENPNYDPSTVSEYECLECE